MKRQFRKLRKWIEENQVIIDGKYQCISWVEFRWKQINLTHRLCKLNEKNFTCECCWKEGKSVILDKNEWDWVPHINIYNDWKLFSLYRKTDTVLCYRCLKILDLVKWDVIDVNLLLKIK